MIHQFFEWSYEIEVRLRSSKFHLQLQMHSQIAICQDAFDFSLIWTLTFCMELICPHNVSDVPLRNILINVLVTKAPIYLKNISQSVYPIFFFFLWHLNITNRLHYHDQKSISLSIRRTSMMKHIITSTVAHLTIPPFFCVLSACNSMTLSMTACQIDILLMSTASYSHNKKTNRENGT